MAIDRRDFLQTLTGGVLISSGISGESGTAIPAGQRSGWYDRPMRWAQLAFVEDDPGNYDPSFWLDYFRRIHADAACLSAGGCVAFYPTKIPLHYRSRWLGNRDAFGDLVKGCRGLGMNVIARTDAHACHQDAYGAHPDWIMVNAKGQKVRHWSDQDFWVTCALGPYNFEFMTSVHKEIMTLYRVDGIFTNRWAGSGMCYCIHCRENFRAFSGMDLPRTNDPQNPARRQYIIWRQKRLFELWRVWDDAIRNINPDSSFIPNAGGALSSLDMKTIGERSPILFADRQGRSGLMPPWVNGKNAKEYRAALGPKPIVGIFSVGLEERYRWKDSVQSGNETRMWVVDGIAHNFRPWFTKFNAKPIDQRWLPVVEELYNCTTGTNDICGTRHRWRGSAWSIRSRRRLFMVAGRPVPKWRIPRSVFTRRWLRPEFRLRWSTMSCLTRNTWHSSGRWCFRTLRHFQINSAISSANL